jgi:hypothetical protein
MRNDSISVMTFAEFKDTAEKYGLIYPSEDWLIKDTQIGVIIDLTFKEVTLTEKAEESLRYMLEGNSNDNKRVSGRVQKSK